MQLSGASRWPFIQVLNYTPGFLNGAASHRINVLQDCVDACVDVC